MILIADGGASKVDWAVVDNNKQIKILKTSGISPIYQSADEIYCLAKDAFLSETFVDKIDRIFFYGAGCIKGYNTEIVEEGLGKLFKKAKIDAQSDMLGIARTLFGKMTGIACILGTGANSCRYDGSSIIEQIPSLGYILGDECSGAYLGKLLINNYFKRIMPADLAADFNSDYKIVEKEVLERVYKQPLPNQYLSSFALFLKKHEEHSYVQEILCNAFQAFISNNVMKYSGYQQYDVGLIGSIAFHFSNIFKQIAVKNGIKIGKILERPIEGLVKYHIFA